MAQHSIESKAERLHTANITTFYFALLAWCIAIAVMLFMDLPKEEGDLFYKPVSAVMLFPIAAYGVLSIWFGLVKALAFDSILKTVAAIVFGVIGLRVIGQSPNAAQHFTYAVPSYLALLAGVWIYQSNKGAKSSSETPVTTDATIRGMQSIFMTGSESFKYVRRNNLDNTSPAKAFEERLIRYLEKKTGKTIFSMFGDNTNYWRINTMAGHIEIMVIANGFNTISKLKDENAWILRVRETGPALFSAWLSQHFPKGSASMRKLKDNASQTQFVASALTSEDAFFQGDIENIDMDELFMKILAVMKSQEDESSTAEKTQNGNSTIH